MCNIIAHYVTQKLCHILHLYTWLVFFLAEAKEQLELPTSTIYSETTNIQM